MRLSIFAIAFIAAAAACAESQPRPIVILVHGRGHMDDDTASLRRAWKADLDAALRQVRMPALADSDVQLAWYADVLDPASDKGCVMSAARGDSAGLETFARDVLGSLASALPRNESREARMLLGDMLYAIDPARRCGAQRRVGAIIDSATASGRPVIVVAYSLGALVTYAELNSRPELSHGHTIRLVTIGSPLGNPEIRELLGQSGGLRLPKSVSSWENVYDPNDAFASALSDDVPAVVDRPITPDSTSDPHHVARYLRSRVTGEALGRALCAGTGRRPEGCSAF